MPSPLKRLEAQENLFVRPIKKIHDGRDVSHFLASQAYSDIMTFLMQLNHAMFPRHLENTAGAASSIQVFEIPAQYQSPSSSISRIRKLLSELDQIIAEVPLDTGPRRFGNMSFRKWSEIVAERADTSLRACLPQLASLGHDTEVNALMELQAYFLGSFGSAQRLDYGTGHELSFLAFLAGIWKLEGFEETLVGDAERAIVLGIIDPYLTLIRKLILIYTLEPAGSHGVWGLDDHSFLPYIFGSAQYGPAVSDNDPTPVTGYLPGSPAPGTVSDMALVEKYRKTNLYFGAIGFIYDVKRGPFWEHSPTLFDISGVTAGWGKINKVLEFLSSRHYLLAQGMIKMYNAEVLGKFPVVQHFPFGSLFRWDLDPGATYSTSIHTTSQPTHRGTEISHPSFRSSGGSALPYAESSKALEHSRGMSAPWSTISSTPQVSSAERVSQPSSFVTTSHGKPPPLVVVQRSPDPTALRGPSNADSPEEQFARQTTT